MQEDTYNITATTKDQSASERYVVLEEIEALRLAEELKSRDYLVEINDKQFPV
jgi:hypothetical protein